MACAKDDKTKIADFLRQKSFESYGIFLCDVDFTQDFSGTFNKEEVIDFLLNKRSFRMQGLLVNYSLCYLSIYGTYIYLQAAGKVTVSGQ